MSLPQNDAEAAYISFALIDELINALVRNRILDGAKVDLIFESVAERLAQSGNFNAQRAAKFITDRMPRKE